MNRSFFKSPVNPGWAVRGVWEPGGLSVDEGLSFNHIKNIVSFFTFLWKLDFFHKDSGFSFIWNLFLAASSVKKQSLVFYQPYFIFTTKLLLSDRLVNI